MPFVARDDIRVIGQKSRLGEIIPLGEFNIRIVLQRGQDRVRAALRNGDDPDVETAQRSAVDGAAGS